MAITGFFDSRDYKLLLRDSLLAAKAVSPRMTFQRMAKVCGIQKTYLSRALGDSKVHLSADSLHSAAHFLGFTADQREFLLLLAEEQRSLNPVRRRELGEKLDAIRKRYRKSESAIEATEVVRDEASGIQEYYLDPVLQLVHMFFTIPAYRVDRDRVRRELGLSRRRFGDACTRLVKLGVLKAEPDGALGVSKRSMHLSGDSPLVQPYRMLLRLRSGQRMQELPQEAFYSFSVLFSCDSATRAVIHEDFLKFLKGVEKRVKASRPEEVHQLNFDLLPWSASFDGS